ncbi:hypothetical protein NON08_00860 [Cetobacterium somerae]|uniref:hypothetical protein n=1 Tax=Cetobacterium sp. NK01 TaxID=2993530 RepID=UPI00211682C6|nr:hypothetical protein [Cetobacterium sp. NK01]MCQ8211121.1 hypothetical protein [Cetobacterium sp. NK01]
MILESALEIRYSSLKLDRLPIEFSTIKDMKNQNLIKTFGVTDLKVEELHIKDCHSRIVEINRKKYLELKNREFKLGLEIDLKEDGSFNTVINNYYYKIYQCSNIKRFMFNIRFLKEIFMGHLIQLTGKLVTGKVSFENRIEIMKLDLLEKEILGLEEIKKEKLLQEENSLYSLALLNLIDKTPTLQSWVNFRCNLDKVQLIEGDRISVERIHIIKGNDFNIREKIVTLTSVEKREIKTTEAVAYRKTCEISLEKIPRK